MWKRTNSTLSSRTRKQLLFVLLFFGVALLPTAWAHEIDSWPADEFLRYTRIPQHGLKEFNDMDSFRRYLDDKEQAFLASTITLKTDRGDFTGTPADLGVGVNRSAADDFLNSFAETATELQKLRTVVFGLRLDLPLSFDPEVLAATLEASGIEQAVQEPHFKLVSGNLQVEPGQIGYTVDKTQLWARSQSAWNHDFTIPAELPLPLISTEPKQKVEVLQAKLVEAEAIMQRQFTLQDEYGQTWQLPLWEHMGWIDVDTNGNWDLKDEPLATYVEEVLHPEVASEPQPVTVTLNEEGKVLFEGSARFGKKVNLTDFEAAILEALATREEDQPERIVLPMAITQPEINMPKSLEGRGITELVSVGHSNFTGSSVDRMHNVNRGMQQFNGLILPQGEQFSFTANMGPIDAANGWRSELVILGDKTEKQYGGGLCQSSSTLFRAALFAGLPINARQNHSYWVNYYSAPYGPGLDATIYDPAPDLVFTNDTPADLLVQAYTDGTDAYFVFYGTNDGRSTVMEGPYTYDYQSIDEPKITYVDWLEPGEQQLESYAHQGFKTSWYRKIVYPDGSTVEREPFHSNYRAVPEKRFEGRSLEDRET